MQLRFRNAADTGNVKFHNSYLHFHGINGRRAILKFFFFDLSIDSFCFNLYKQVHVQSAAFGFQGFLNNSFSRTGAGIWNSIPGD